MGYSASAVAYLGVLLPREKVIVQSKIEHSCNGQTHDKKKFKYCPDCGEKNIASIEDRCIFDKENDPDYLTCCPIKINELDFDTDHNAYDDLYDYFYLGLRIDDFAPITKEIIDNLEDKIFRTLYEHNIIPKQGAKETGIPKEFQFGIHSVLHEG